MNFLEAQQDLANTMKTMASSTKAFFWRLSGDEPNSLCRYLGMDEEELKIVLRLCKIYTGEKDNFSKNNFELLVSKSESDWTTYRLFGKAERFIRLGHDTSDVVLPKDQYDALGKLSYYPIEDVHMKNLRTKSQRGSLPNLLNAAMKAPSVTTQPKADYPVKHKGVLATDHLPKSLLYAFVQELVMDAAKFGDGKISSRCERKLQRLMSTCIDSEAKQLLHSAIEKYVLCVKEMQMEEDELIASPEKIQSSAQAAIVSPVIPVANTTTTQDTTPLIDDNNGVLAVGDVVDVVDEDEVTVPVIDDFLIELKEEVLLQTLLLKRVHEKNERVFELEHRNGRRLLVVLPPDTQSVASFEEEATRTQWVAIMLNSEERVNGMLTHLAKLHPEKYIQIAKNRRLSTKAVPHLTTAQTLGLARVGKLNDVRLRRVKSYLHNVAKVQIHLSAKEIARLDLDVGLHRTTEATFGTYLHDWTVYKGKEKKAPELVNYWNSSLSSELEVETDLYLQHLALQSKGTDAFTLPLLDYDSNGFDNKGVTVLFGGDHGDHHCPISCKINFSTPEERKQRDDLGYHCPVVSFASVGCSKDDFEIMDRTVMPTVKKQLKELQQSSIITVYHRLNTRGCFRSYTVPSTIQINTLAFLLQTNNDNDGSNNSCMTFAYGVQEDGTPHFGSVTLDDKMFSDVPYHELAAKMTISKFNECFIGDLAFLAMLIGMKNSSGDHCLMCEKKGSEFNCNHNQLTMRTRASLEACLAEFMRLSSLPKKPPANYKGVNCAGLWDIDPQRIIVPILHCPMGLVDKILESMKQWVNLNVEDYHDDQTESVRSILFLRQQQYELAVQAHEQACGFSKTNPTSQAFRDMQEQTKGAKSAASSAYTKAKADYKETMLLHNAKKTSINQLFEGVYRANGVKREHYHGGKFNGVNCIRIMGNAKSIIIGDDDAKGFVHHCRMNKIPTISDEDIQSTCQKYCRLLGLLDAIWSAVRGLHSGLLPSEAQQIHLQTALLEAKELWIQMKLSTLQPKWHLTFDGHLLAQVKKYGGLADKSDETIEKWHQVLKALRERYRGISSYAQRETCIRRELRRTRSTEIQAEIDKYQAMIKRASGTKRANDISERIDNMKKAKQEKREAYVANLDGS
jgi:hypothetical protein